MAAYGWRNTPDRGFDPATRTAILTRDPWCRGCASRRSTVADHIVPISRGGSDHVSNGQGLCGPCHAHKTSAEASEGRAAKASRLRRNTPGHPGMKDPRTS